MKLMLIIFGFFAICGLFGYAFNKAGEELPKEEDKHNERTVRVTYDYFSRG